MTEPVSALTTSTPAGGASAARIIRAVLTHPVAMWIKARLRVLSWMARSAGVTNPPVPARVRSVLFVCLGNICRSPFAAKQAARLLAGIGDGQVVCTSAGIRPSQAERSPAAACTAAARFDVALDVHLPQPLTREAIAANDMVIVMEAAQWHLLREAHAPFRDRIFLLSLFDAGARNAYERCNIEDPFGQPVAAFEACYARIDRALRGWIMQLER
jgi:protein-tyrosine phosphatase